jgi:hypothetical protein
MPQVNWPVPYPGPMDLTAPVANGTIFPSASRAAATYNSSELANNNARGVVLYISTTNMGAAGTLVVKVQSKNPVTGNFVDIPGAVTASITTVQESTLTVYPGAAESANVDISDPLGQSWRVVATVGANAIIFSIGGVYLA